MKKTIGIFAHVDAGKTTFSEALLFNNGSIRQRGRVDDKNTALDTDDIEKQRGITVFSGTSFFEYNNSTYYIIDTPGHSDFFPEARRTMPVIDYAVILISAADSVRGHTALIWNRLRSYNIPTVFFINKTDMDGVDTERVLEDMKLQLSQKVCMYNSETMYELTAESSEEFMEKYLDGTYTNDDAATAAVQAFHREEIFPVFCGSALKNDGIDEFMKYFDILTNVDSNISEAPCSARVYKILNDKSGNRVAFLRLISGTLNVKQKIAIGDNVETVNELRFYRGSRYELKDSASAGDICAVTGLKSVSPGDVIGHEYKKNTEADVSVLRTGVNAPDVHVSALLDALKTIEDEEPTLRVEYDSHTSEVQICTMGKIQLEILQAQLLSRFGINAGFDKCSVLYKETVAEPIMGYGHFEPLKHYAEVHVELRPGQRNTGISFLSELSCDKLPKDKQNLIEQYSLEGDHRGILTCSPLTDVQIVLKAGAVHEKHTHGGDLKEALERAVRQALEYARNILLEPWYAYSISVPAEYIGKLMTDLCTMSATYESPETLGDRTYVRGLIPVAEAFEYFDELILFTKGKAQINATLSGYDVCHNADRVIEQIAYDKDSDRVHSSDSVFCSHGSGYIVPWHEAKGKMHIKN